MNQSPCRTPQPGRLIVAARRPIALACLVLGAILAGPSAGAAGKTVWDGVYLPAQAERGQTLYAQHCSSCHGDFLDGDGASGRVVALSGAAFADNWESASLNDLFVKIARTMPRGAPGTLQSAETLDLIAFLLQFNGFPSGATALAETPDLALVDIVSKDGPQPLRVGSGVRTVGCLTLGTGNAWTLTRASALVRTRNPAASTGADAERARVTPLGSKTIRLTNAKLDPQHRPGTKVEAKGALSVVGAEDGITVMSLQVVAPSCE
jgi:mono/diheme cytochrome c family protein